MCAVLNISPKTYYKYRNKEDPDYYDYLIIKEIYNDSKGTYGYRRIVEGLLLKYGVVTNWKAESIRKTTSAMSREAYKTTTALLESSLRVGHDTLWTNSS